MSALAVVETEPRKPSRRGTSNTNKRGNTATRRQRREWLITTYRADVDIYRTEIGGKPFVLEAPAAEGLGEMYGDGFRWVARCYRCGDPLTVDEVTADRIFLGVDGGEYGTPLKDARAKRTNLRPSCLGCASSTGGFIAAARRTT